MEEALEERILKGVYAAGSALPPVRVLARELGTSPSTVSRALQALERRSWVNVTDRRGASVASTIPQDDAPDERTTDALLALAVRWRLYGRTSDEFLALVERVAEEAFRPAPVAFFVECNAVEVATMSDRVAREVEIRIEPLLVEELRADPARVRGGLVLTTFFHRAEVRGIVGDDAEILPLAAVPSEAAMRALSDLPRDASVVAVGPDERTAQQIAGLATHYALARAVGVSLTDTDRLEAAVDGADVVVVTNAAGLAPALLARERRVVVVEFELEASGIEAVRAAIRSAEAALVE